MEKTQIDRKRSFFSAFPDEIVLIILSYGTMKDIHSTRVWQTEKVELCTETRSMWEAAKKNNLDNESSVNWAAANRNLVISCDATVVD